MAEVKWIKITTDIFNDEKIQLIESMPDSDTIIVIWFKLLSLAGKSNNGGLVMISDKVPYTNDMLATLFRRKKATVELALLTFEQFGMIERLDNDAILISNWDKHQNIDGMEKIKIQNRERQRRFRESKTLLLDTKKKDKDKDNKIKNKRESVTNTLCNVTNNVIITFELFNTNYNKDYIFSLKEIKLMKLFSDIEVNDLFESLLIQRTKLKKPAINTRTAIKTIYNKLKPLGNTDRISLLSKALESGWKTVYTNQKDTTPTESAKSKAIRENLFGGTKYAN